MTPSVNCAEAANGMRPLTAVVIYDHFESGCRAKALLDQATANAGGEIQFSLALWRIDRLAHPGTSNAVFQDLRRSMILVLALRPGGELPKLVSGWVECWAHSRAGGDSALVILGNACSTVEELGQIARRHRITLLCEQIGQTALAWQDCSLDRLQEQELTLPPIWEEIPDDSRSGYYRHWGVNE